MRQEVGPGHAAAAWPTPVRWGPARVFRTAQTFLPPQPQRGPLPFHAQTLAVGDKELGRLFCGQLWNFGGSRNSFPVVQDVLGIPDTVPLGAPFKGAAEVGASAEEPRR